MRRVIVLLVALGLLIFLDRAAPAGAGSVDPTTLAAVGFVVLAAFTVGELGGQLGLPRITGYILCGVGLGPQIWNLLSGSVVEDMKVFNTLALGLIALTAGLELDLGAIRKVFVTLLATLVAKLPLLLLLVGGTAFGLELAFGFLDLQTTNAQLVVALILAILGIGTSPAIVLAVSNEAGAKGRLTDLILALAVVKDLVVVISLAVGLALGAALLGGHGGFDPKVLLHVAEELGGSLLLGALIGVLLVTYVRFVHQEMLLVVLVVVLVGAEATHALHLELLLVFITAGFVVKNFSRFGEKLHHPLERVALPVFVVFFTTAGATVDLRASFALLPLAGSLVLARMLAFFLAGRVGAWMGGEDAPVRNWAWLGYWPQAGITLGLVSLAAKKLPQLSTALNETGFAVVAINLLVGPIMVGWALRGAGETSSEAPPEEESSEPKPSTEITTESAEEETASLPVPELAEAVAAFLPQLPVLLETEPLVSTVEALARDMEGEAEEFLQRSVGPLAEETHELMLRMLEEPLITVGVRRALGDGSEPYAPDWEEDLENLRGALVKRLVSLPARLVAPLSQALLVPRPSDGILTRFGRWRLRLIRRLRHSGGRTRAVRLRVLARYVLEPRIAEALRAVSSVHYDHHAHALDAVRGVITGQHDVTAARAATEAVAEQWVEAVRRELLGRLRGGFQELAELARDAGAPGARASQFRLSDIEARLLSSVEVARRDTRRWQRIAAAGRSTLRAEALVEEAQAVLSGALRLRVREPLALVRDRLLPVARGVGKRLESVHEDVEGGDLENMDLTSALARVSASLPKPERKRLERARAAFGRLTRRARLPDDLARLRGAAPERLELLTSGSVRDAHAHPERVNLPTVPFAERMEFAIANLIGQVRDAMAPPEALILASDGRLRDATHLAVYGVEAAHTWETEPEARQTTALRAIARGRESVERFTEELASATDEAEAVASDAIEKVQGNLQALIQQPRAGTVRRVRRSFRVRGAAMRSALHRGLDQARDLVNGARQRLAELLDLVPPEDAAPDAAAVGRSMESSPLTRIDLPPIYRKVFDLEPVDDRRLAIARETEVTAVLAALERLADEDVAHALGGARVRGRVLVEGARGSGRTTFLNMIEREAKTRRLVRVDASFHPRGEGLVGALAAELGCPDYPLAVTQTLITEPTLVLIDDLSHHVMPNPAGLDELEELLRIVVDTSRQVSWVATAEIGELAVLANLVPIFGVFTHRHRLAPLGAEALGRVVEARVNLTGLDLNFPPSGWSDVFRRGGRDERARSRYFEALARTSGGNLREALLMHLASLRPGPEGSLGLEPPRPVAVPHIGGLGASSLACMALVARFGPLLDSELAEILLMSRDEAQRHTAALLHAGLLRQDERRLLRLPLHAQRPLTRALVRLGLVIEEAA